MSMMEFAWLIPLFPLVSFIILLFYGKSLKERSSFVGIGLMTVSFVFSLLVLLERLGNEAVKVEWNFLTIGDKTITFGMETTALNVLMLVIVSLVSLLVHIYSRGYMAGDQRIPVFYSYLGLFTFAMLALVMSTNFMQFYIFWELVGVGSFLLIGFYYYKDEAKKAAKKAFIMTRIGDMGLLVGILLIYWNVGSFEYSALFEAINNGELSQSVITTIALLLFVGAIGKSGQFPLHTWLPDAMEGPTPVSALIHAATMVAAGVYLVAATFPVFEASSTALQVVAWVGGFTAIFAATIAIVQTDIKRILAYSTVSQLGYMMLALGSAGYVAGVFHLMTHAFFKALLFLAAGSVIHAVHSQNIFQMGGLWKKLAYTAPLFLMGTLALSGFPLTSGFFSKDEILIAVWESGNVVLFIVATLTAFLTAFYMFRLFFIVFTGQPSKEAEKAHESPKNMVGAMIPLAVLALIVGWINTPWIGTFLGDWLMEDPQAVAHEGTHGASWIAIVATVVSLLGIYVAYVLYGKSRERAEHMKETFKLGYTVLQNKYYMDELYHVIIIKPTKGLGKLFAIIDEFVIGGIVGAIKGITETLATLFQKIQNGQTQTAVVTVIIGFVILAFVVSWTGGYWS